MTKATANPNAGVSRAAAQYAGSVAGTAPRRGDRKAATLWIDTLPPLDPQSRARVEGLAAQLCNPHEFIDDEGSDVPLFAADQRALADLLGMLFESSRNDTRVASYYYPVIALDYWYHCTHLKQRGVSKAIQKRWGISQTAVKTATAKYGPQRLKRYWGLDACVTPGEPDEWTARHIAEQSAYWRSNMARRKRPRANGH